MITKQQIIRLNTIIHKRGLMDQKATIVGGFTGGRTESSKGLTTQEADELITVLQDEGSPQKQEACNRMRRKIISIAYELGWADPHDWKTAVAAIDAFTTGKHGIFCKKLNDHSYIELVKVVSQFDQLHSKFLKSI